MSVTKRFWVSSSQCLIFLTFIFSCTKAEKIALPSFKVGDQAPDFSLKTLDGRSLALGEFTKKGSVVLIVLRGYPGYQCPVCSRQVRDFVSNVNGFSQKNLGVLMVYPGAGEKLKEHAEEFLKDKSWPSSYNLVIDPDFTFTKLYKLRWEKEKETAYPATYLIDKSSIIRFAKVSSSHYGRSTALEVLKAVNSL